MVEFYYNFFSKNYKSKIMQLIVDIDKLLAIENIKINNNYKIILDKKLISSTLKKFLNKNTINKKFSFVDTFAGGKLFT